MWKKPKKPKDPQSKEEAMNYALYLLGIKFWGREELLERLKRKGFETRTSLLAVKALGEFGYLEDTRLLENIVKSYAENGTHGRRYVQGKLLQRKFSSELLKSVLDEFFDESMEIECAKRFLEKEKIPDFAKFSDKKIAFLAKQKLMAKMQRRGFGLDVIQKTV